jgi:hypothetical protein
MAASLATLLNGIITVTDTSLSPSPTIITRNLNNPTLTAQTVFFDPFFGGGTVTLPAATVFIVYVKNIQASGNITVSFTPVGAGGASSLLLVPGAIFLYFMTSEAAGGISAVSTTASTSSEVMVAA